MGSKYNRIDLDEFYENSSLVGVRYLHSRYRLCSRLLWFALLIVAFLLTIFQLYTRIKYYNENPLAVDIEYTFPSTVPFPHLIICNSMQFKISSVYQMVQDGLSDDAYLFTILKKTDFSEDLVHFFSKLYGDDEKIVIFEVESTLVHLNAIVLGLHEAFTEMDVFTNSNLTTAFQYSDLNWASYYYAWTQKLSGFPKIRSWIKSLYSVDARLVYLNLDAHVENHCQNTLSCLLLGVYKVLNFINNIDIKTLRIMTNQLQSDFILKCKWQVNQECKIEQVVTDDGLCYKITQPNQSKSSETGPPSGLLMVLDTQTYEGFPGMHSSAIKMERYRRSCGLGNDKDNDDYDQNTCVSKSIHNLVMKSCDCMRFSNAEQKIFTKTGCVSVDQNCAHYGSDVCMSQDIYDELTERTESMSGLQCFNWAKSPKSIDDGYSHVGDHNQCRNPDNSFAPWCFVNNSRAWDWDNTEPITKEFCWNECPVGFCLQKEGCAIFGSEGCMLVEGYQGYKSSTLSGRTCQRWNVPYPHFSYFAYVGDHNYCRNPGKQDPAPWCYTTDPDKRYEYCFNSCSTENHQTKPNATSNECVNEMGSCAYYESGACRSESAYLGEINKTKNGLECQKWSSQIPHSHQYYYDDSNYCRTTSDVPAPWCYTILPSVKWDYCFDNCPGVVVEDIFKHNCISEEVGGDCVNELESCADYTSGACSYEFAYIGNNTMTKDGLVCQHWSSQTPHTHAYYYDDHNYCRTSSDADAPWCYTIEPAVKWNYCFEDCSDHTLLAPPSTDSAKTILEEEVVIASNSSGSQTTTKLLATDQQIPGFTLTNKQTTLDSVSGLGSEGCVNERKSCADYKSGVCRSKLAYLGKQNMTRKGLKCQNWSSQTPHSHDYYSDDNNYCRTTDDELAPWCYTIDPLVRWQYCFDDCSDQCVDLKYDCAKYDTVMCKDKSAYTGEKNYTETNISCLSWQSVSQFVHVGDHNSCRNPDGDRAPWCLTKDTGYEYCFKLCQQSSNSPGKGCITSDGCAIKYGSPECASMGNLAFKTSTMTGKTCQAWASQIPHAHGYANAGGIENYCDTLGGVNSDDVAWCYTTDPGSRWENCYPECTVTSTNTDYLSKIEEQIQAGMVPVDINKFVGDVDSDNETASCSLQQQFSCVEKVLHSEEKQRLVEDVSFCPIDCNQYHYVVDQKSQPIADSNYQTYLPKYWDVMKQTRLSRFREKGSRALLASRFPIRLQIQILATEMNTFISKLKKVMNGPITKIAKKDYDKHLDKTCDLVGDIANISNGFYGSSYLTNKFDDELLLSKRKEIVNYLTEENGLFTNENAERSFPKLKKKQYKINYEIKLSEKESNQTTSLKTQATLRIISKKIQRIIDCGNTTIGVVCIKNLYEEIFGDKGAIKYSATIKNFFKSYDLLKIKEEKLIPAWNVLYERVVKISSLNVGMQFLDPKYQTEADFTDIYDTNKESYQALKKTWLGIVAAYENVKNVTLTIADKMDTYLDMKHKILNHNADAWPFPEPTPDTTDIAPFSNCFRSMWSKYYEDPFVKSNWLTRFEDLLSMSRAYTPGIHYDKNNLIVLNVYFGKLKIETITQHQAFGTFDLLADIGGTLGLYMGATIITIVEIISFICEKKGYIVVGVNDDKVHDSDKDSKTKDGQNSQEESL